MKTSVRRQFFQTYGMLLVLAVLFLALSIAQPRFLGLLNLVNLARQISIIALLSAGQTLVILSANIDLSVGSVLGLAGVVGAGVLRDTHSPLLASLAGLGIGSAAGLVSGVIVGKGKIASFIVTLAMLGICSGVTLLYTGARPIPIVDPTYTFLGQGKIYGLPFPIILMVAVYFLLWIILTRTPFGRHIYAIGGNEQAAQLAGVNITLRKTLVFLLSGALAALTGIILTARLESGVPTLGTGFELTAITAVVLGGTNIFGGEGRIWGTLIGAAITELISNGLNMLNVNAYYQSVATGSVVLIAVLAARWLRTQ